MDTAGEAWPVAYLGHGQEKACLKEIWNRPEKGLFQEKFDTVEFV